MVRPRMVAERRRAKSGVCRGLRGSDGGGGRRGERRVMSWPWRVWRAGWGGMREPRVMARVCWRWKPRWMGGFSIGVLLFFCFWGGGGWGKGGFFSSYRHDPYTCDRLLAALISAHRSRRRVLRRKCACRWLSPQWHTRPARAFSAGRFPSR